MNQKRGGFKRQVKLDDKDGDCGEPGDPSAAGKQEGGTVMVTADEAAKMCRISRAMLYKLHAAGKMPRGVKLGNLTRWRRQELLDWIKAGCLSREKWEAMKGRK